MLKYAARRSSFASIIEDATAVRLIVPNALERSTAVMPKSGLVSNSSFVAVIICDVPLGQLIAYWFISLCLIFFDDFVKIQCDSSLM